MTTDRGIRHAARRTGLRATAAVLPAAIAVLWPTSSRGFSIDTVDPDLTVRADTSVRYNLGLRAEGVNNAFARNAGYDETETRFNSGDVVTNRIDLLEEIDVIYRNRHGVRFSGAGWRDFAYGGSSHPGPGVSGSNYVNSQYNGYARRYIVGPRAEVLDAFVFTGFDLGDVGVRMKLGQHNLYWGESLYTLANSIAYSQGPVDTIKAATSPGSEAKELFMPLKQISVAVQLTHDLALEGQYLLDWKPFRLVPGGTYFASADGARSDFAAGTLPNGDDIAPDKRRGNWGVNLRWSPAWLESTLGVYYRRFDERLPWSFTQLDGATPQAVRLAYARGTELYGLSLTKNLFSTSFGAEVSYRRNTALNAQAGYVVQGASYAAAEGPRGDTVHALVNTVYLLPPTALWVQGALQAELTFSHLVSINQNPDNRFYGAGNPNCGAVNRAAACVTTNAWGMNLGFEPAWPLALPRTDLSLPISVGYGIKGVGATLGGVVENVYNYAIGVTAKVDGARHVVTLRWADISVPYETNPATGIYTRSPSGAVQNHHGWVSLSYKTTF